MRAFDHSQTFVALPNFAQSWYPATPDAFLCEGTIQFTSPGSPADYLSEVASENPSGTKIDTIKQMLLGRLKQINAKASAADIDALLASVTLDLGESAYIYNDDSGKLTISKKAPSWVSAKSSSMLPDGKQSRCDSSEYNILGNIVNPPNELGLHGFCFANVNGGEFYHVDKDPTKDYVITTQTAYGRLAGQDSVIWTNSSGYGNLLGELRFENKALGKVTFSVPN